MSLLACFGLKPSPVGDFRPPICTSLFYLDFAKITCRAWHPGDYGAILLAHCFFGCSFSHGRVQLVSRPSLSSWRFQRGAKLQSMKIFQIHVKHEDHYIWPKASPPSPYLHNHKSRRIQWPSLPTTSRDFLNLVKRILRKDRTRKPGIGLCRNGHNHLESKMTMSSIRTGRPQYSTTNVITVGEYPIYPFSRC